MSYSKLTPSAHQKPPKTKLILSLTFSLLLLLTLIDVQMILRGDFPKSEEQWPWWEEYSEGDLPEMDWLSSETRDNTNTLKWFSDRVVLKSPVVTSNQKVFVKGDFPGFDGGKIEGCGIGCEAVSDVAMATVVVVNGGVVVWEYVKDLERLPNQEFVWFNADAIKNKKIIQKINSLKKEGDQHYYGYKNFFIKSEHKKKNIEEFLKRERLCYTINPNKDTDYEALYKLHLMNLTIDYQQMEFPSKNSPYKFYIHFNSQPCKLDQQVLDSVRFGEIPVVFGVAESLLRENLPLGSYLSADQFTSAAELAEYLLYLDEQDEAFRQYHLWRTLDQQQLTSQFLCNVCRKVAEKSSKETERDCSKTVYQNLNIFQKINRYRMKINYYFMRKVEITKEKVTYFSAICILMLLISLLTSILFWFEYSEESYIVFIHKMKTLKVALRCKYKRLLKK